MMLSVNKDFYFLSYLDVFLNCLPCLTALATTSSIMLNRSDKNGHPCLGPNLKEKAHILSPLCMMLLVSVS